MDGADYKVIKYPYFIIKLHLYNFQIAQFKIQLQFTAFIYNLHPLFTYSA